MNTQRLKSVFRSVVLSCAAALGLGAWAADPTAEWCGDFPVSAAGSAAVTSEKGGLTITKNNTQNTSTDEYMMVKERQGWPMLVSGLNTTTLSVVVGYQIASDVEGTIIAPSRGSTADDCRFRYNTVGGNLKAGYVGNDSWADLGKAQPTDGAIHYAVMTYSNDAGSSFYHDGVKLLDATGLKEANGAAFTEIDLGAIRGPNNIVNGIKFYYVAVYSGTKLSDVEARAAYELAYVALNGSLSAEVQASASGTAFNTGDYVAKNVTVTGETDGYLDVTGAATIGNLMTAGEPFTAKLAAGSALSAASIDATAAAMTVDVSQYDWATLAANAVDGVPYYVWPVLSSSVSGTVEISGVSLPFGCTYETVAVAGYGVAVKISSPYKAGSLSINFPGGRNSTPNNKDARVTDNANYSGLLHGIVPVVGTSWNDVPAQNSTDVAVANYIDGDGVLHTDGSATVTLSQVNNPYHTGDNSGDRILYGYCDDGGNPQVVINNIPFEKYRVVAYASTDTGNAPFSPKTINEVVYSTVAQGGTETPTLSGRSNAWGLSNNRGSLAEGVNYLVSDVISGTRTVTIKNPKTLGRAGIAAVQIVEVAGPKVHEVFVEDGGTYAFNPDDIAGDYVKLSCEGSFTLVGKDGYAVSEEDFGKYIDITSVTGTITFGAGASVAFGSTDALDGTKFAFGAGSSVRLPYTLTANYDFADGTIVYLTGDTENTGSLAATFKEGVNPAALGVTVIRKDGGYCAATWNGEGAFTYNKEINTDICAEATVFDLSFKNTIGYAYKQSGMGCNCDVNPATYNNDFADKTTGLYLKHRPYTTGNFLNADLSAEMTVVVVGQLPSASTTFFLSMGTSNGKGLIFATTDVENELLVAWNSGSTMSPITTMSVPNGTLSRHVYAVTKQDDGNKSNFTVYLDGTPWKTLSIDKINITDGGFQVGADFGGNIRDKNSTINGKTMVFKTVATSDTGVVNAIRLFDSVLSDETIKAFSAPEEYPYASPFGDSSRTFEADGNWVETESTPWTVKPNGGAEAQSGAAIDGSSLTIVSSAEDGVTVSVNLDADKTYEALMIDGDPITFEFAEGKTGVIRATGAITIAAETTIKAGALAVGGATTILDNGKAKLVFDYSGYDASVVTVANPQATPLVLASMAEQAEGIVTCIVPTTPYRTYSFGYANGGYNLSITADKAELTIPAIENLTATVTVGGQTFEGVAGDNGVTYQVPAGETATVEYAPAEGYVISGATTYIVAMTGNPKTLEEVTAVATKIVAMIDETPYTSLAEAVANADGNTVTLVADVTLDARVEPARSMTVDLGEFTITRKGTSGNGSVFDVKSGSVVIKNGTINCTQDDTDIVADGVYAITARSGATVTLEGLTVTVDSQAGACAYPFDGAKVMIKSGTYKNTTEKQYQYKSDWIGMAVNQANVATQLLFIEGGSFAKVNPALGDDSGKVKTFLAKGYATEFDGENGVWVVVEQQGFPGGEEGKTFTIDAEDQAALEAVLEGSGKTLTDTASESTGLTYAQAYALGLLDEESGELEKDVTPTIEIKDGKVVVSLDAEAKDAYKVMLKVYEKASLLENWPEEPTKSYELGSDDEAAGFEPAAGGSGFYKVVITIEDK